MDPLIESLRFQIDQAYAALTRAATTFFQPDAKYASLLYREAIEPLLQGLIEAEQRGPVFVGLTSRKRPAHFTDYQRSTFERFVLEWAVGQSVAVGLDYLHKDDYKVEDLEKRRDEALSLAKQSMGFSKRRLNDLAKTFSNVLSEKRGVELVADGSTVETAYAHLYILHAATAEDLQFLSDCPQSREMIGLMNMVHLIRQLYEA